MSLKTQRDQVSWHNSLERRGDRLQPVVSCTRRAGTCPYLGARKLHGTLSGSCTALLNGIGIPIGVRCAAGYFPILSLDPSTQLRVYQHFPDPERAKALFASLTHEKADRERREKNIESTGELIVRALNEWDAAGFPGSWDDWWDRWWQKHVKEHNESLTWMRSGSGLSFWDGQKHRSSEKAEGK